MKKALAERAPVPGEDIVGRKVGGGEVIGDDERRRSGVPFGNFAGVHPDPSGGETEGEGQANSFHVKTGSTLFPFRESDPLDLPGNAMRLVAEPARLLVLLPPSAVSVNPQAFCLREKSGKFFFSGFQRETPCRQAACQRAPCVFSVCGRRFKRRLRRVGNLKSHDQTGRQF